MIGMKKGPSLAFLMLVIAAQPMVVRAGPPGGVSEHFPNDGACGGPLCNVDSPCTGCGPAALDVRLHVVGEAPFAATAPLAAGDTGVAVATAAATALCTAIDVDWACGVCAFPGLVTCTKGARAVDINQNAQSLSFSVVPGTNGTVLTGLHCRTDAGNTHGPDLLNKVLLRVDPNAHNGNVVIKTTGVPMGMPSTFTVDTTGKTDQQLHDAIRLNYSAIGLPAFLRTTSDGRISVPIAPSNFKGFFVELQYPSSVSQVEVNGQPGQILVTETVLAVTPIPTLSEWGMASLVVVLLLMGLWMLLRRQRTQPA